MNHGSPNNKRHHRCSNPVFADALLLHPFADLVQEGYLRIAREGYLGKDGTAQASAGARFGCGDGRLFPVDHGKCPPMFLVPSRGHRGSRLDEKEDVFI